MNDRRWHGLDALRGGAMLLGIALHATLSLMTPVPATWPAVDASGSVGFAILYVAIHAFRMPLFFLLAGIFAHRMLAKRGPLGFAANRTRRVVVPLAIGVVTLVPLLQAIFAFGYRKLGSGRPGVVNGHLYDLKLDPLGLPTLWNSGEFVERLSLFHLWFLWYLLILYAILLLVWRLPRIVPSTSRLTDVCGRAIDSRFGLPMLIAITLPAMSRMVTWTIDTPMGIRPEPHLLVFYGLFFAVGCLLARRGSIDVSAQRGWKRRLLFATVLFPIVLITQAHGPVDPVAFRPEWRLVANVAHVAFTWLMTLGVLGWCLDRLDRPRPAIRLLADASYWMYLAHLPLVVLLQIALADVPWPGLAKFTFVVAVTTVGLLVPYVVATRRSLASSRDVAFSGASFPRSAPASAFDRG